MPWTAPPQERITSSTSHVAVAAALQGPTVRLANSSKRGCAQGFQDEESALDRACRTPRSWRLRGWPLHGREDGASRAPGAATAAGGRDGVAIPNDRTAGRPATTATKASGRGDCDDLPITGDGIRRRDRISPKALALPWPY